MKIFFTSDTHFNQERTFKYSKRDMYFTSVEESTEEMVRRWNEVVSQEDTVYHLGDFGDFEVAKRLNGHICLLYGNYERDGDVPTKEQEEYFEWINKNLGTFQRSYLMVHEPEHRKPVLNELLNHLGFDFGNQLYLFGHIHEKQKVKRNGLNVGVDVHNFTPVNTETVEFYREAIQNIYDDNCFSNY